LCRLGGWMGGWMGGLQSSYRLQLVCRWHWAFCIQFLGAECDHHIKQGIGFAAINENWLVSATLFS
jgi:hypothetical protein